MGERERARVLEQVQRHGGLRPGVASEVAREAGLPEAEVFGAASFYHLLAEPDVALRICDGVSCALAGAQTLLEQARARGLRVEACGCLAACDRAPAVLRGREVLVDLEPAALDTLPDTTTPAAWRGTVGPEPRDPDALAIDLLGEPIAPGSVLEQARARGAEAVLEELERSGLQGRGGAGFPAATKWRAVRSASGTRRFVVCNADEGEPGTFKDREVLLRRPDLVLEGLAIAAACVGAAEVFIYLRGAFSAPRRALERALRAAEASGAYAGIRFELHMGHGAYICGEETALLEALEGRRGMPRCKPPYPTERGLWGAPTLMHNVETIACVPAIVRRGGAWFRALGRTEPGTKLYCVSGHVQRPGVYELPLGVCLDELVQAAGGYR
ncbi:MAG: NADP oxidoreductase, partial [Planctomycetota bacterium]